MLLMHVNESDGKNYYSLCHSHIQCYSECTILFLCKLRTSSIKTGPLFLHLIWILGIVAPYFNNRSTWSKAHGTGAVRACPNSLLLVQRQEKTVGRWSKGVVPILLISNGCVLGITCNKPIRVSSLITFKSQLHLRHGGFAIYMVEFASAKTERISREETHLLVREQIGRLILKYAMTIHYRHFYTYVA